jgi:very-short-patch-repair endonuclease
MTSRRTLPAGFGIEPILVASAAAAGVTLNRLESSDLSRPFWGVRVRSANIVDFESRCHAILARLPSGAFIAASSAAILHGIPVPWHDHVNPIIHVGKAWPGRAPHAAGIIGHKYQLADGDLIRTPSGLLTTSPVRTWLDVGGMWGLLDLVAAGDFLIHWDSPLVTAEELAHALQNRRSRRGLITLHTALPLLHPRSESPPESFLRVIIQLAGLPEPSVNHRIDDSLGNFVARMDLLIAEFNIVLEYQGDYHRDRVQWRRDMTRRGRIESTGRRVMELNADDLRDPIELIARIRRLASLPPLLSPLPL